MWKEFAGISEVHAASIFRVEVCRVDEGKVMKGQKNCSYKAMQCTKAPSATCGPKWSSV
jgi:hypothetical protein